MMAAKQYDTPLRLTTPYMRGQAVKDAQWLLAGHSRFEGLATYKDGDLDGEYGPLTAQATKRAKYWLGYADRACDGTFGQTVYEYLRPNKWRELPKEYQARRADRIKLAMQTPGLLAFKAAEKEIGYHESPAGSNSNKFGREYGWDRVPWCAIFESIMFKHTGWTRFRYAAVMLIYYDAVAGRNGLRIVRTPQRGDVVCYSFGGSTFAHTAFFDQWTSDSTFRDLAGNTSATDFANGGEVAKQERSTSLVKAFVRVG